MKSTRLAKLLIGGFIVLLGPYASAQTPAPIPASPLPGTSSASLVQIQRWFELDAPFSRHLKFTFDTRPAPTFEMLQLPSFEGRASLWNTGRIDLSLFEHVAPSLELDCMATCQSVLQHKIGIDFNAHLGAAGRKIPDTFLFFRNEGIRQPRGFTSRTLLGIGGLLDF
jgi:hypothetical protein